MNSSANALLAKYVAKVTAGEDIGRGSDLFNEAVEYLESQLRELNGVLDYNRAKATKADRWVPANGGYETECRYRTGRRLLYCYNFAEGRHAYLDLDQDRILSDREALVATATI